MAVRPGYKQTEVGVIPEDWEVRQLGGLGLFGKGKAIKKDDVVDSGLQCIRYGEIYTQYNDCVHEFNSFIAPEVARQSQRLRTGDLLFAGSGETAEEIGKCVAFLGSGEAYAGGDIVILSPTGQDSTYLGYLMNYASVAEQKARMGQGDAVVHISSRSLGQLWIPVPPLPEQRAIAAALSDVDALIAGLERLIEKKRAIRQGTMQELLTGKRRLPGFAGEWEVRRFGEIAVPRSERIDPRRQHVQGICVELEHIGQASGRLLESGPTEEHLSLKSVFRSGDVLFGKLRAYLRKYWLADCDGVCSTEIWALAAQPQVVTPGFLFTMVQAEGFIEAASTAYGTHMPRSDWSVLKDHEVSLPRIDEQHAIAAVLSDMDAEIAALEARRDKTLLLKQGMMQELLTGRTRLV